MSSLSGLGSRCLQGCLGARGHARVVDIANATGSPRLTARGQTSFGLVKQDCRGAEGKRAGETHGAREGWKRDRGKERAREREREKGGRPMACGVRGSPWPG